MPDSLSHAATHTSQEAAGAGIGDEVRIIALVGSGHFLAHFYVIVLPPMFPLLHTELGASYAALGLLMTVMNITTALTQVPVGFLVDRIGAAPLLAGGLALMGGGTALAGLAGGYWPLVALMALVGAGNSVFHPADYAIMAKRIAHHRLGRAFSVHTALGHFGWALAPVTIGVLSALWNWHVALVVVGLAGLAMMAAVLLNARFLDAQPRPDKGPKESARETQTVRGGISLLLSPAMLMFFAFMVLTAMANSGLNNFSVSVLVDDFGASLADANVVLTVFFAASTLGVLLGGVVADRIRRHELVMLVGFVLSAAALALIASIPLPFVIVATVFALAGTVLGAIRPSRDIMVRAVAPDGSVGKVFGFVTMGLNVGGALAPVFFGWLIDRGAPEWVFYTAGAFMLLALASGIAGKTLGARAS